MSPSPIFFPQALLEELEKLLGAEHREAKLGHVFCNGSRDLVKEKHEDPNTCGLLGVFFLTHGHLQLI